MINYRLSLFSLLLATFLSVAGCAHKDLMAQRDGAYRMYHNGDYAAAALEFELLVEQVPQDAELWFRLGNSYAKTMNPKKAVNAYENALLRDPEFVRAWYNKGVVHLQEGLKSFIDMKNYVPDDEPVGKQGARMREGIFNLLGPSGEMYHHEE